MRNLREIVDVTARLRAELGAPRPGDFEPTEPFDDDPPPRRWKRLGRRRAATDARDQAPPLRRPTEGTWARYRRNLCICVCLKAGLSQRFVAKAFDLPRSVIQEVEKKTRVGGWDRT